MAKTPKILAMCPDLPYPIVAGGQMRMASICEALSKCSRLHMACIAPSLPEPTREWARALAITIEHVQEAPGGSPSWCRHALAVAARDNLRYASKEKHDFDRVFRQVTPDLIWLETPYLLRYVLDRIHRTPVAVDYWGTSEGAKRLFRHSTGIPKIKEGLKWWAASGSERRYARKVRDIVCVSNLDALYFKKIAPLSRTWPIPNGIVKPAVPDKHTVSDQERPLSMIFTGDLSYRPNVDAAVFFADRILPMIREELPGAVFRVVGRNPSPSVLTLKQQPGIDIVGFVPDLAEEVTRSTIYVLPMRLGSGIRSKLFDVFPLAKGIVTTTIGAEGLELRHDRNCLIADEAPDFARSCIRLLNDDEKRKKLGNEAGRLASEVYTQENIDKLVNEAVKTILAG